VAVDYPPISNRKQLTSFDVYYSLATGNIQGPIGIGDDNKTLLIVKYPDGALKVTHEGNNTNPQWVPSKDNTGNQLGSASNPIAQVSFHQVLEKPML